MCVCVCVCVTRSISWATECDTEVDTEGRLGGHCSAVKDGVLLGKREAGERSMTGRGPHIFLSFATT